MAVGEGFVIGDRLTLPAVAVGTMYFGTRVPAATAHACLDRAFEVGARFWDTSNNYAFWAGGTGDESETCIGRWLAARPASVRGEVVIATKVGARPRDGSTDLADALGLSGRAVRAQVTDSLRRLRTERVDLLYAHIDDPSTPLEETLGIMSDLVDEGLVGQIAASNLTAHRLRQALAVSARHRYRALQQRFTYLQPDPSADLSPHVLLDDDVADVCTGHGLTMLGYSPLLSGAYTRPDRGLPPAYDTPPNHHALHVLAEQAHATGLDPGQVVLAWMTQRRPAVLPVVGVSRPEHVDSAWQAVGTRLGHDTIEALDRARRG